MEYKKRTIRQHRTEWFYYRTMADYSGHTAYEIYEEMCKRFLLVIDDDGDFAVMRPTSLSTIEHNAYMEQIRCLGAEYGVILPDPEVFEFVETFMYKKIAST